MTQDPAPNPAPDSAQAIAFEWLSAWRTASLATVADDGTPHACNLQFALHDRALTFISSPASAHARHLAISPTVALTAYAHQDRPSQIHGVQLHGQARLLKDAAREAAINQYLKALALDPARWRAAIATQNVYAIAPTWIRIIDNRRGFGFKLETHSPKA